MKVPNINYKIFLYRTTENTQFVIKNGKGNLLTN